ncbi:MAG: helix-turn-helix domain-containing protein [Clostridia bacterium]|nr:helix-turn-helix domain-containing protein [Clostridia bacterium]
MKNTILKKYDHVDAHDMCGIKVSSRRLENGDVPIHSYPLHRHDYFEIEWLAEGKIHHELNGEKSVFSVGDICGLSPVDLHKIDEIEEPVFHNISIDYKNAPKAIQHIIGKISFPIVGHLGKSDMAKAEEYFWALHDLTTKGDSSFLSDRIIAYTLLLLSNIFDCTESLAPITDNSGYYHIARAMEYIAGHFDEPLSLGDVAKAVSLSSCHLSLLFRKISGVTFLEYLTEFRIGKAQNALLETDMNISEIAFACGFGSFPSFSRSFKQMCGCSPSEYRKNSRI